MNVLMMPTMRCNLTCDYCHFRVDQAAKSYHWTGYGKDHEVPQEVDPADLIKFVNKIGAAHYEFTGGEPLLYKGFKDLILNLPAGSTWAITSNTLIDPAGIDMSKCKFWTASYHAGGDRDKFKEHIRYLRDTFGRVAVSFVVPFDDVRETLTKAVMMRAELQVQTNLLRELNPGVSWTDTDEWSMLIGMRAMGFNVVEDDIPEAYVFDKGWLCHGGEDYICVMPEGNVYRCYSEAMDGKPIGTVTDFELAKEPYDCYRECYGCAFDHKSRIAKLIGGQHAKCS